MTVAELKKLWEPAAQGQIMKWSQIREGWPDEPIKLYGAGSDSGTFDYFTEAIVGDPEIILFDEPTSALDPRATARIEELVSVLKKQVTVLIVTHNMQQAVRISDYTGFMYLGELAEFGSTTKIFNKPANRLTEEYISGRFG